MEKKTNCCPKNVCKMFSRAFRSRRIRRMPNPQNLSQFEIPKQCHAKPSDSVPISYDYSSQTPSQQIRNRNPEAKPHQLERGKGTRKLSGVHIEDRFSEFINTARIKLGNVHNSEESRISSGKKNQKLSEIGSMKDRFSDYIDRTKKKLRTTSDVGTVRNTNSFK